MHKNNEVNLGAPDVFVHICAACYMQKNGIFKMKDCGE